MFFILFLFIIEGDKKDKKEEKPMQVEGDISNKNGIYKLYAVLAHQGRNADGGHYVAYVRQGDDVDNWLEFNDAKVFERDSEYILKLSGKGGMDMPIAYMVIFCLIDFF